MGLSGSVGDRLCPPDPALVLIHGSCSSSGVCRPSMFSVCDAASKADILGVGTKLVILGVMSCVAVWCAASMLFVLEIDVGKNLVESDWVEV